jgi:hypothetical protein
MSFAWSLSVGFVHKGMTSRFFLVVILCLLLERAVFAAELTAGKVFVLIFATMWWEVFFCVICVIYLIFHDLCVETVESMPWFSTIPIEPADSLCYVLQ